MEREEFVVTREKMSGVQACDPLAVSDGDGEHQVYICQASSHSCPREPHVGFIGDFCEGCLDKEPLTAEVINEMLSGAYHAMIEKDTMS